MNAFERQALEAVRDLEPHAYGLPIRDHIEEARGRRTSTGAVSVTLQRLVEDGLLTAVMGEATAERGWRRKRYYHLTEKGRRALLDPPETPRSRISDAWRWLTGKSAP